MFAFIVTFLPDWGDAEEVLAATSVVLWQKWSQFQRGGDFVGWACGIAHRQTMAYLRECRRQRQFFSEEVVERLAQERLGRDAVLEARRRRCAIAWGSSPLGPADHRRVLRCREEDRRSDAESFPSNRGKGARRLGLQHRVGTPAALPQPLDDLFAEELPLAALAEGEPIIWRWAMPQPASDGARRRVETGTISAQSTTLVHRQGLPRRGRRRAGNRHDEREHPPLGSMRRDDELLFTDAILVFR